MPFPGVGRCWPSLVLSVALLVPAASAEAQRSVLDAQIQAMNARAASNGMRPAFAPVYGSLREDEQARLTRRLAAGTQYIVYGVCDADCEDFDLAVTGSAGRTVGSDVLDDDSPIVTFTTPTEGEYTITAAMASCDGACGYAVVILGPTASASDTDSSPDAASCTDATPRRIATGQSVSGRLTTASCKRDDGTYAVVYRLDVPSLQTVVITMASPEFDAWLRLEGPNGVAEFDDDGAGGTDARISVSLEPGTYRIYANTLRQNQTGSFTLRVAQGGSASTGSTSRTSGGDACALTSARPVIAIGETIRGSLTTSSCRRGDGSYADVYRLVVPTARTVTLTMRSGAFDAYLSLRDAADNAVDSDDDGGSGTDARLSVRLQAGTYYIFTNTLHRDATGDYTIQVTD